MRPFIFISVLLPLVLASPIFKSADSQSDQIPGMTETDVESGGCHDVTLIFARGSGEIGNMGSIVGPALCSSLKETMDSVSCQGVGGAYRGGYMQNVLPDSTDPASVKEAVDLFKKAADKCPKTKIIASGFSQGSAVIDNAVQKLDDDLKSRVKAAVLFGFTRNVQDNGRIPDYPKDQTKVFCVEGDLVCVGILYVTAAHLTYGVHAGDAATFVASKLQS